MTEKTTKTSMFKSRTRTLSDGTKIHEEIFVGKFKGHGKKITKAWNRAAKQPIQNNQVDRGLASRILLGPKK